MNFAELWAGEPAQAPPPDGDHTCEIVSAKEGSFSFKAAPANPRGDSISMVLRVSGYQDIEEILPGHLRSQVEALCAAAGVASPPAVGNWDPAVLVGRWVTVTVAQRVSKRTGRQYTAVVAYKPGPASLDRTPIAQPPARARTPAAKAHQEFTSRAAQDDVPF